MTQPLIGVGLYTIPQAARLLRLHPAKLQRWAEGYPFASKNAHPKWAPLIRRDLQDMEGSPILTFHDLLELYMIGLFRSEGVSLQTIRAAAQNAATLFSANHPFVVQRFETDGKSIFATLQEEGVEGVTKPNLLQDLLRSQMVMDSIVRPFFRQIEYCNFEPIRWFPNGKDGRIVLDPKRSFGKPIDVKSGVPTEVLYEMARGGEPLEKIAKWYRIEVETVQEAVWYENSLKAA
jgi:uncharacterized protein (DUF433 family)/DNA-binding transcriptional MerR regulator